MKAEIHTLSSGQIARLIESRFRELRERERPGLEADVFRHILWAANEYVPSESGSVTLGDPRNQESADLIFIASFGSGAQVIPGTQFPASQGISGRVYRTGRPCIRNDVTKDSNFYRGVDEKTSFTTRSIMSVPILIEGRTCGVVSMLNRLHPSGFRRRDLRLMEIFCSYISTSIQNMVDYFLVQELARTDHLSGLLNDRSFYTALLAEMERAEAEGQPLGLIFLDLDHFKGVVDQHGHLVGSRVLAEVGRLLARTVQHPGALLARYGGDEYVVILPKADRQACLDTAEAIRVAIRDTTYLTQPLADGTPALNIQGRFTASLGVASLSDCPPAETLEARRHTFIRMADAAMYQAKAAGKNCVRVAERTT